MAKPFVEPAQACRGTSRATPGMRHSRTAACSLPGKYTCNPYLAMRLTLAITSLRTLLWLISAQSLRVSAYLCRVQWLPGIRDASLGFGNVNAQLARHIAINCLITRHSLTPLRLKFLRFIWALPWPRTRRPFDGHPNLLLSVAAADVRYGCVNVWIRRFGNFV